MAWAAWGWELESSPGLKWEKQRGRGGCPPRCGLGPHLLAPCPAWGGAYPGNLADGDGEAVRGQQLRRGHSHAPLLRLPTVFLDLLWGDLGSA